MNNTYELLISSPNGEIFKDEVTMLTLRGIDGDLAILANHIPFVTTVLKCQCKIGLPDGTQKLAETDGGLLTVGSDNVTFLTGSFIFKQ